MSDSTSVGEPRSGATASRPTRVFAAAPFRLDGRRLLQLAITIAAFGLILGITLA